MQKKILVFVGICSIFCFSCFSQTLTVKESSDLQRIVYYFFEGSHSEGHVIKNRPGVQSELIICLFSIDSLGKIEKIHLLADDKNKDSAFARLSLLEPNNFKNWKAKKCKNKTVMIPLVSLSPSYDPKYVNDVIQAFKSGESKNLIIMKPMVFGWIETKY